MVLTVIGTKVKDRFTAEGDGFVLGTTEPTALNTGVGLNGAPSRAGMIVINGDYTVTADNQSLSDRWIKGRLLIGAHKGFHGTNLDIEAPSTAFTGEREIVDTFSSTGMNYLDFCRISYTGSYGGMNGPGNKNLSLYRCDISKGTDNGRVNMAGSGSWDSALSPYYWKMEGCYLHDQMLKTPDPLQFRSDYKTHSDGIQFEGNPDGSLLRVYGNAIWGYHSTDGTSNVDYILSGSAIPCDVSGHGVDGSTGSPRIYPITLSCVMITPSGGHNISGFQLEKNWFYGGNNCVNGPDNITGTGSVLKDNRFAPYYDTAGNRISPPTWTGGMVKSGNTNISDGSPV